MVESVRAVKRGTNPRWPSFICASPRNGLSLGYDTAQPHQKRNADGEEATPSVEMRLAAVLDDCIAPITVAVVNASRTKVDTYVSSTGVVKGRNIPFGSFTATTSSGIR